MEGTITNDTRDSNNGKIQPLLIDIDTIQREYLPLSKKKIRSIANTYLRTVRIGNKILVDRKQLEAFISDPDRDHVK